MSVYHDPVNPSDSTKRAIPSLVGHVGIVASIHTLDPKRQRALELFLAGHTVGEVSAAVGINRVTLYRWRLSPEWQAAQAQSDSDRLADTRAVVEIGGLRGAEYLKAVADGKESADAGRIRASEVLLARALPVTFDATSADRERRVLAAAVGGEEAVIKHIGEAVTAAWGFAPAAKAGA